MTKHLLILTPSISSKLIIGQYQRNIQFYCYSSIEYDIELWTNLSDKTVWTGLAFTKIRVSEYALNVNTSQLFPQDYEFTLRFKSHNSSWQWYGKPGQNGIIRIRAHSNHPPKTPVFAAIPQLHFVAKEEKDGAYLWHFNAYQSTNIRSSPCSIGSFVLGRIDHLVHSYTLLIRRGSTWLMPVAGHGNFCSRSPTEKWQMLLYQDGDEGNIHLLMPMSQKGDCWLSPEQGNRIRFHHTSNMGANLLIATTTIKHNFTQIIRFSLDYFKKLILQENLNMETFKSTEHHANDSIFLDKLGYCTWNAFGKEIKIENLYKAVDSLKIHDIPIGYLLLDDGWQCISNTNKLVNLDACSNKFPGGLKNSISQLRRLYPRIQHIGVWHILWGYWNGIDESLANKLGSNWSAYQTQSSNSPIGIAEDSRQLYQQFYAMLEAAGVDFVKVDNQGSFQDLDINYQLRTSLWDSYRRDMIKGADRFFNGRVLHCMALTPHILLDPIRSQKSRLILRNSDDFFPNEKESHSWHIYANAINSLLTSQLGFTPDWDMFQSDHMFAEYHASSRAISGGPIYITDPPYKHNTSLIQRLVGETRKKGYTILCSQIPPEPTFETVFDDPMSSQSLLTMYNLQCELFSLQQQQQWQTSMNTEYGVCGFWNTGPKERLGVVSGGLFWSSENLGVVPTIAFVVSGPEQGKLALLQPSHYLEEKHSNTDNNGYKSFKARGNRLDYANESLNSAITARVSPFGSTIISVSPVKSTDILSIACLGLIDKFNGTRAIASTSYMEDDTSYASYEAILYHRSSACGFWVHIEDPTSSSTSLLDLLSVQMDGVVLKATKDWNWCLSTGLLVVNMMAISLEASSEDTFCIRISVQQF